VAAGPSKEDSIPARPSPAPAPAGLLTDRLSPGQEVRWREIVKVVLAGDDLGRPLHPTLRRMWNEVAASGHDVHVELPGPTLATCATAGVFRIESVGHNGHVVALLRLNLPTIDRGTVGRASHSTFRRFDRLGREGRYAEVLGHELGHAVFTLAEPDRARHLLALQERVAELGRAYLRGRREDRPGIRARLKALDEQLEALERPAREAEALVWRELSASEAARQTRSVPAVRFPVDPG
jgi:hypothetical protein